MGPQVTEVQKEDRIEDLSMRGGGRGKDKEEICLNLISNLSNLKLISYN